MRSAAVELRAASPVSRQMVLDAERAVAAREKAKQAALARAVAARWNAGRAGTPSHRDVAAVERSRVEADRYRQMAADVGGHYGVSPADRHR